MKKHPIMDGNTLKGYLANSRQVCTNTGRSFPWISQKLRLLKIRYIPEFTAVPQIKNSNKKNIVLVAQPCDMQDYINKNYDNYAVVYKKSTQRGRKKKPATVKQLTA